MAGKELLRLQLDLWHEDCWTIEVTENTDGNLVSHGAYVQPNGAAEGRFTVFGESADDVEDLISAARDSRLTSHVQRLHPDLTMNRPLPSGNHTQEIFVEYDSGNSIDPILAEEGFIQDEPNVIKDGRETWNVVVRADRTCLQDRFDRIRERMDAEIRITRISSSKQTGNSLAETDDLLSTRQREVFNFAREQGYYSWPREVTVQELASQFDLAKTTMLEHLRKAEAKLLSPE
ncbi:helix-turn-helix domain-containing protein [Haloplanus pelagicus]|jgi:predicted DNA binding protein|uniref:helix-turn-helix domain-containing protein n=1 Tax=Haloplanus pelagicus TaxID=2949995 RepID=UPI0020402B77|nr:helix-turn-helix domain-containing protein [Haloplanus sp. HW8-1]